MFPRPSRRARSTPAFGIAVALVLVPSLSAVGCADAGPVDEREDALGVVTQAVEPSAFRLPPADAPTRARILARYTKLDPDGIVPRGLFEDAIEYYDLNRSLIPNGAFVTVVDFTKFSGEKRFFVIDMESGAVEAHAVAHGSGTDPESTGYAKKFSNTPGSNMSSLGFYLTGEIYDGTHPHSMRLHGLSVDGSPNDMANTNVLTRYVVVHEASYVSDAKTTAQGRSNGCLALDPAFEEGFVQRVAKGSLIYAALAPLHPIVGKSVPAPEPEKPVETPDPVSTSPAPSEEASDEAPVPAASDGCSTAGTNAAPTDALPFVVGVGIVLGALRRRRAASTSL